MEAAEDERGSNPRRGKGRTGFHGKPESSPLKQRIYRAIGYLAAPGLWGSLVYPSGFGSLRRQFKSAQPHSPTARRSRSNDLAIREAMAPEDGGPVVQLNLGLDCEEAPREGRRRPDDPHG